MVWNSITITIEGELPGLNEYTNASRTHRFVGSKMKKEASEIVIYSSIGKRNHGLQPPYFIEFHWYCKNKRKDKDNVAFAKKFILDGFQEAGIIPQDSWKAIEGFRDLFFIDAKDPRIEVIIRQAKPNISYEI